MKTHKGFLFILSIALVVFTLGGSEGVDANPEDGVVVSGNATISMPLAGVTEIVQTSDKAIINWSSFNIGAQEKTQFIQPSASSIALNRIDANQGASSILGQLIANGQVWLINPAGIFFGLGAQVDVAGLLATTADVANENFMKSIGTYNFQQSPNWNGSIINQGTIVAGPGGSVLFVAANSAINTGTIKVGDAGMVAMVAPWVQNTGVIQANLGRVILSASTEPVIDFYGDRLISFDADGSVTHETKTGVSNSGAIIADGGRVRMTASAAKNVLDNVINNTGYIRANSVQQKNGEIILGDGTEVVKHSGQVQAFGGKVKLLGKQIALMDSASIDVSSDTGGGAILIGGNAHGLGPEPNADYVFVGSGVTLSADALTNGNGGKIVVWSDIGTQVYGTLSVRGGALGGNGGWMETSGKQYLDVNGITVDARAPYGLTGTWLLDPTNIWIADTLASATFAGMTGMDVSASVGTGGNPNTFGASGDVQDSLLLTATLTGITGLGSANVIVTTTNASHTGTGNITIVDPVTWASANTLTLIAADNIAINAAVTTGTAASALILQAGGNVTQSAVIGGSGGLTLSSVGTTTLNQANTYLGATTITSGTVVVNTLANSGTSSSLGSGTGSPAIQLGAATLQYTGTGHSSSRVVNLTGAGTIDASGSGTLTLSGGVTGATKNLILTGSGLGIESGVIGTTSGTVTKSGAGTWTLSNAANTYTGGTSVNGGTLSVGTLAASGANSGIGTGVLSINTGGIFSYTGTTFATFNRAITIGSGGGTLQTTNAAVQTLTLTGGISNAGALTFDTAGAGPTNITISTVGMSGAGSVTKTGAGVLTFGVANTYTGATAVNVGTLTLTNASGLGSGGTQSSSTTVASNAVLNMQFATATLGNTNTITLNGSGIASAGALTGSTGTDTLSNAITLGSDTTIGGANNLTLNGVISGGFALTKAGAGTLTLGGSNTYTGATSVNVGTLTLSNANALGSVGTQSSGTTVISGAALSMNFTTATLGNTNTITLSGTGVAGTGALLGSASTDTVSNAITLAADTTIGGGNNMILSGVIGGGFALTKAGAGTLTLSGLNTYTGKTTISAGGVSINSLASVGGGSSSLGAPTTVGNGTIDLAGTLTYTGSGHSSDRVINLTGTSTITGSGTGALNLSGGITGTNQNLTLSGTATGANASIQSGAIATGTGTLAKTAAGTWILTGTNTYSGITTITTGTIQIGNANALGTLGSNSVTNNATLTFNRTDNITINNAISGTGALTQAGTGILTLSSTSNTYSGATTINAGTLQAGAANTLSANSAVTLANALNTNLDLNSFANTIKSLAGGGGTGGNVILGSATLTIQNAVNASATTFTGNISGLGGLTINLTGTGSPTQTLAGANTYTGATLVSAGILSLTNANALGSGVTQSSGTTVTSGAVLNTQFATATLGNTNTITLSGTGIAGAGALTGSTSTDTLTNNITLAADTTIGGANNMTLSGVISGGFALTKAGAGTLTLSGLNTYTGKTTISAGTLSVNTIGNVSGGSSSLGAPITVGNGTIDLGAATLLYTGSGHSSDRVINLTGAGTVTASGAGTLTLTGGVTGTNQNLTLSGTGTGIESGAIATGTGTLGKTAAGTWILGGTNTYSGITTITTGTLQIGNANAAGTLGSNSVTNNATLTFNRTDNVTINNAISGTGAVTQAGTGITTLGSTSNTYSGTTTINAGTLQAGAANTLSANSAVTLANASSTNLDLNNFNNTIKSLAGGGGTGGNVTLGLGAGGLLTIQNAVSASSTTFSGILSGNGGLTINLTGTSSPLQVLAGANTYAGLTTVTAGTLRASNATALGSAAAGTTVSSGATLDINAVSIANGEAITIIGTGASGVGALTGTGTGSVSSASTITLAGDTTIGGAGTLTLSSVIDGPFALTKTGAGTLALAALNTYTGKTTINAGTLSINTIANVSAGSSSLGAPTTVPTGTIDLGAATLLYTGSGHSSDRVINLTGAGTITGSGTGALNLSGGITGTNQNLILTGTATGANASIQSGVIAIGSGTLTKAAAGTWTLSGLNTYSGITTISAGTLSINSIANVGGGSSALGAPTTGVDGTIALGAGTLMYTGTGHSSNRVINLTGAGTIDDSGSGIGLTLTGGITGTNQNLTLTGTGTAPSESGAIATGSGTVTKSGLGTWTLSGTNTYTGLTTVSAGTLAITSAAGLGDIAGATTISSGGTLEIRNVAIGNESINLNNGGILLGTGTGASLSGNITLAGTLGTSRTISTSSGTDVLLLTGTINGAAPLIISGSGTVTLAGLVGNTTPLSSITSNVGSTTNITSGSIKTSGSQTYSGIVSLGADTTFTISAANSDILMGNAANNITNVITYATTGSPIRDISLGNSNVGAVIPTLPSGLRNLTLTFNNAGINFPALTLTGTLTATAGGNIIQQSGGLAITGVTTLAAGANNITLQDAANNFGTIGFSSGNNVTINDLNAVILGASTITGTLNVTAGAAITQSGILSGAALIAKTQNTATPANITLGTSPNIFSTIDLQTLNLGGTAAVAGAISYQAAAGVQINRLNTSSGAITITTAGNITEGTGAGTGINTTGTSTFTAGSGSDITLTNAADDFGTIAITSGRNVLITDPTAVVLGTSTISGTLGVTAGGSITQSGATILTITGTPTFTLTTAGTDVLLGNANVFNTTPVFTGNGNIRDLTLRNTAATAALPVFPASGLRNLNLTFNNADMTFASAPTFSGTFTASTSGIFSVADGVTLATTNAAIAITAVDFNLNTTGALSSGTAATTLTESTASGSIGLGTAGTMTVSASELQRMSAGNLSFGAPTDGQILVGALAITDMPNITGTISLTATAGSLGSVTVNSSATFARPLTLVLDQTLTVNDGVTFATNNQALSITAKDINLNTTGTLNSGTGNTTIAHTSVGGSIIELGNPTGGVNRMGISGSELQRITTNNLAFSTETDGSILIDGITAANTANIAGTTTLTATAGTLGSITFQNNSSTFTRALTLVADNTVTVNDGITAGTSNAAISISAKDLDLAITGAINSGTATTTLTENFAGGSIGLGNFAGTMSVSGAEMQRITAGALTLVTPVNGSITVDSISAANSANIAGTTTLTTTGTGVVTFQTGSSTFTNGLTASTPNTLTVNNVTVATTNAAISLTAKDLDLATTGALNSGTAGITITENFAGGSIGVGNVAGTMSLTGAKLQRMTAETLSLVAVSNGSILVDGVTAANTANIAGITTLNATAGTTGFITFQTASSQFSNGLTVTADAVVTVNDGLTLSTINTPLSIIALNLDMGTTAALNSGTGNMTIRGVTGNVDVGNISGTGTMIITQSMLQRMTAQNLTIANTTASTVFVDNVALADTANIAGTVTFDATNSSSGVVTFQNNASTFKALAARGQDAINVNVALTTTVGDMTFDANSSGSVGPLNLSANLTAAGSMTLRAAAANVGTHTAGIILLTPVVLSANGVTITSELNGAFDLTINSGSGSTIFQNSTDPVQPNPTHFGNVTPLASLTVTGPTNINIGDITTTGAQTYNSPVTLGNDVTLTANTSGNINFADTVNGAFNLVVNTAGVTTFGGAIGGTAPLTTITTDAPGSVAINAGSILTTGAQTYNEAIATIGADTVINASGTSITFGGTIDSPTSTAKSLTLTGGAGTISVGGVIGGTHALNNFTMTKTGATNDLTISNNINTTGNIILTAGRNVTLSTGSLNSTAGNISLTGTAGLVQETGTGIINGGLLTTSSVGGTTLNNANTVSGFNATNTISGDIALTNSGSLTITGVADVGKVTVVNTGAITLGGNETANSVGGDSITLLGTSFNNAGGYSLNTGSGRFLIWSANPASDNRGGLAYNFKQYNATYGVTAVQGTGSGFLYTLAPTITPVLTGTVSKVYNANTTATLSGSNYSVSGAVDGDTVALNNPTSGLYDTKNVGSSKNVAVTGIAITSATNGSATVYGYQVTSTANANVGVITPASLTITPDSGQAKGYGTNDVATGFTYAAAGLYSGDTMTGNLGRAVGEDLGNYAYNAGSVSAGSNYTTNVTSGATFAITPATITITAAAGQSKVVGASDPNFTYTYTGVASGVTPSYWNSAGNYVAAPSGVINDTLSGALSRVAGESVGNYNYTLGSVAASAPSNYLMTLTPGTFAIVSTPTPTPTPIVPPVIEIVLQDPGIVFMNNSYTPGSPASLTGSGGGASSCSGGTATAGSDDKEVICSNIMITLQ